MNTMRYLCRSRIRENSGPLNSTSRNSCEFGYGPPNSCEFGYGLPNSREFGFGTGMRYLLLAICSGLVLLTGCTQGREAGERAGGGGAPSELAASAAATGQAAGALMTHGGVPAATADTLKLSYGDDPDTLNLLTSNDTVSGAFQRWVYEPLARPSFSNPDELVPELAESWEFDGHKLEYTIHLRKGIRWHPMSLPNGTALPAKEFSARDVKFTFDCILNPHVEAAALRSYYEDPDAQDESERTKINVTAVDSHTVKVNWTKPYFLSEIWTLDVQILPRHVYSVDANGEPISFDFGSREFAEGFNNHWANTKMCGTGPLMFKKWKRNQRVVLQRNPNYWGRPFYFSKVNFDCIPNPNTMVQKLLQNELDWSGIAQKDQYIQAKDHSNVKAGKVKLVDYAYPGYRYIGYNVRRAFLRDKRVRWALSHAVPVQTIIDEVFKGLASRTTGPFLPGSSAYNNSLEPIPFDLKRARQLLHDAGWRDSNQDGVRDKAVAGSKVDARFSLMIYSDSPQYLTIAEIIKEAYRKIGVDVQISPTKWALMLQKLRKKEFDASMLGWALSWKADPFQLWHGSQADLPESSNAIGYRNPQLDKLIEQLRVTMDPTRQTILFQEIHRVIYEDQPYTFLFMDAATAGHHARLQNIRFYKIRPCYNRTEWFAGSARLVAN